jgi:hypothetical protein
MPPEQVLSAPERNLRDRYVAQYLKDYDSYKACIRLGYSVPFAKEYAVRFLNEAYVLNKIAEAECRPDPVVGSDEEEKKKIVAALWREANNMGYGSSQSARVAALAKLSAFHGMDAPTRSKSEVTGADGQPLNAGIFVVPGLMTAEEWEKQAEEQQEQLTRPEQGAVLKAVG